MTILLTAAALSLILIPLSLFECFCTAIDDVIEELESEGK